MKKKCKVVIIGAGASGLQCAQELVSTSSQAKIQPDQIIILEAKNRIGGRVYTSSKTIARSPSQTNNEQNNATTISYDEGAAWVHGTGSVEIPNPMIKLISEGGGKIVPISPINAGTEPRKLHYVENLTNDTTSFMFPSSSSLLTLYLNGYELPLSDSSEISESEIFSMKVKLVNQALKLHENRLRHISNIGNMAYEQGEGMLLSSMNLAEALNILEKAMDTNFESNERVSTDTKLQEKNMDKNIALFQSIVSKYLNKMDEKIRINHNQWKSNEPISLVAGFYLHLLETWHGTSLNRLPLDEFINDNSDNESNGDSIEDSLTNDAEDGSFPGPHCIVDNGGMATALTSLLSNGVDKSIYKSEEVVSIELLPSIKEDSSKSYEYVKVICKSGFEVDADICICTVSLGCLKASMKRNKSNNVEDKNENDSKTNQTDEGGILFQPQLSDKKIEAIHTLQMGSYKKVFLTFDSIFWSVDKPFMGLIRRNQSQKSSPNIKLKLIDIGNYLVLDNFWAKKGLPCLEVTLVGKAAQNAYNESDDCIIESVLQFIYEAMPFPDENTNDISTNCKSSFKCVQYHITRWEEDRFTRGAYSYYACHASERHYQAMRESEWKGRLIFSGEANDSVYQGSLHAALLSGLQAAQKVFSFYN